MRDFYGTEYAEWLFWQMDFYGSVAFMTEVLIQTASDREGVWQRSFNGKSTLYRCKQALWKRVLALSAQNKIYAEEPTGQKKTEVEADLHLVEATITLSVCRIWMYGKLVLHRWSALQGVL